MKYLPAALLLVSTSIVVRAGDTNWNQSVESNGIVNSIKELKVSAAATSPAQAQASALLPATVAFLKELGIDPQSNDILTIAADSVTAKSGKVYTLDTLAAKRDETGVKSFIATRVFIRAFYKDSNAEFPDDEFYNILYLTAEEKSYISKKLLEAFPKPK